MRFRIGINLADVIADDERIYGDGVNIAGRIDALAEPAVSPPRVPRSTMSRASSASTSPTGSSRTLWVLNIGPQRNC